MSSGSWLLRPWKTRLTSVIVPERPQIEQVDGYGSAGPAYGIVIGPPQSGGGGGGGGGPFLVIWNPFPSSTPPAWVTRVPNTSTELSQTVRIPRA